MTQLRGIAEKIVDADLEKGTVRLSVEEAIYPLDAVYAAAFAFIDEHWVFVDLEGGRFVITLSPKEGGADEAALHELVGRFANLLVSAAWRARLTERHQDTIEIVTRHAFAGAMGPPTLDELEEFDFTEDPFEDPLGIATAWEDRHGKKNAGDDAAKPDGASADDGDDAAEQERSEAEGAS